MEEFYDGDNPVAEMVTLEVASFQENLQGFLDYSPTPYHAVLNLCEMFDTAGFQALSETEHWNLEPNGKYYVVRDGSSVAAFTSPSHAAAKNGIRMVGAHTDSPCLKLNPGVSFNRASYNCLSVEVYGSPLLRTWFDRELSIAGLVHYRDQNDEVESVLVNLEDPIAIIPSVAIHLERDANVKQEIDSAQHIQPMISVAGKNDSAALHLLDLIGDLRDIDIVSREDAILGFDLSLYDVCPVQLFGPEFEFIASARIDNLVSCFVAAQALCDAETDVMNVLVCNDHEEVGSVSDRGARGPFLTTILERTILLDPTILRRSLMVSADGAHGVHPNYSHKHEDSHRPVLNNGIVIKHNANQRYATTSTSEALFRNLCRDAGIKTQDFVSRNDMPCGSTIGPLIASELGVRTIDVGIPQLAMHSIRETAGMFDIADLFNALIYFYANPFRLVER